MAETDVKQLMLQVDASVELLRKNLAAAEAPLTQFENRAGQMGDRVNRSFQRMGQGVGASSGQMRAGMQQLSFQLNDVATQFASGQRPMMIFAQQAGQVIQSIQVMAGGTSKFAAFLGGPWGVAITSAVVVMTPYIAKLLEGSTAAQDNAKALADVRLASSGLTDAQGVLGQMFDLTTGKMKAQNEMLRLNIQLTALRLRAEADAAKATSEKTFGTARTGKEAMFDFSKGLFQSGPEWTARIGRARQLKNTTSALDRGLLDPVTASKWAEKFDFTGLKVTRQEFLQALVDRLDANNKRQTAGQIEQSVASGKLDPVFRQEGPRRRGPSAESLARRAEAERVRELNEDSAYTEAERRARHMLIEATRKTAESEQQRDSLLREDINAEAEAAKRRIANDLSAKKLTDEQAKHLTDLAEQTRLQKLTNVESARRAQTIRDTWAQESQQLDHQEAILRLQEGFAGTVSQRRDIQQQLLAIETKRLLAEQQAIIDQNENETAVRDAKARQEQIRAEQGLRQQSINYNNPTAIEDYRRRLTENVGAMDEALQRVDVNGLQSLEDGLVGIITGTESVSSAFKQMANQIIADLARIAIQKLILNSVSGGIFSALGFAEGGPVLAKATGGFIIGAGTGTSDSIPARLSNGEYVLRAEAVRKIGVPVLDMLNSGQVRRFATGGLVAPGVPALRAGIRGGGDAGGVSVNLTVNAPGATGETISMIRRELAAAVPQIVQAATANTKRELGRKRLR